MEQREKSGFFGAQIFYPKIHFEEQFEGENVLLLIRQHPFTQIYWIFNSFILTIALVAVNFLLPILFDIVQILFFNLFAGVLIIAYILLNFLAWFFHVGVISDRRIIDIDFHNILHKEVTIADLRDIEEINSKSIGYIGSIFNYGDIFVQTAGMKANIEFLNSPDPALIVRFINELTQQLNSGNNN